MTKQEFKQASTYWQRQIDHATRNKKNLEKEFIDTNAPYPIGTKVQIEDYGNIRDVKIISYNINPVTLELKPVFDTLEGKAQFTDNPTIIKVLD